MSKLSYSQYGQTMAWSDRHHPQENKQQDSIAQKYV